MCGFGSDIIFFVTSVLGISCVYDFINFVCLGFVCFFVHFDPPSDGFYALFCGTQLLTCQVALDVSLHFPVHYSFPLHVSLSG